VFFVIDGKIITPELSGSILEGGVRNSTIALIKKHNWPFEERKITIDEIVQAHHSGKLQEAFGTGTAAVISPIGELEYHSQKMVLNDGKIGSIAQKLYNEISAIQYGDIPDEHGWTQPIIS
jgi:branched-chain amino acid aminotransferase